MSKQKGAPSEITEKRDAELMRLYNLAMKMVYNDKDKSYTVLDVYDLISTLPAEGYFVSEDSAWRYITARRKGRTPSMKSPQKRLLYETLYDKVMDLRIRADYVTLPTQSLMFKAMVMRAPCIGLSPSRIRTEIERIKREHRHGKFN